MRESVQVNNDNFLIEETDLELAKNICKYITKPDLRNRAVANYLAASLSEKYFTETEVDTKTGIHNIYKILETLEISDVYIEGSYVDVRLYFENSELTIPKELFDKDIKPVAYMFIKLDSDASGALVTGFYPSYAGIPAKTCGDYYIISEEDLVSYYDIQPSLVTPEEIDIPEDFNTQVFEFLDGKLLDVDNFIKTLLASKDAREKLANAANVQTIFKFVNFDTDTSQEQEQEEEQQEEEIFELNSEEEENIIGDFDNNEDDLSLEMDSDETFELEGDSILEPEENEIEAFTDLEENDDSEMLMAETEDFESLKMEETQEETLEMNDSEENISFIEESAEEENIIEEDLSENTEEVLIEENETMELPEEASETFELQEEPQEEILISDNFNIEETPQEESLEIAEESETPIETQIDVEDEIVTVEESDSFEFKTNITPSLEVIEEDSNDDEAIFDEIAEPDNSTEEVVQKQEIPNIKNENEEQIDALFGEEYTEENAEYKQKSKTSPLLLLGILAICAGVGYFGYTKYLNPETNYTETAEQPAPIVKEEPVVPKAKAETALAMPVETIENIPKTSNSNEGNAVSVPAIEQSLDASVLVTNLAINWEVPSSYVSNKSIERYFQKMGKIIHLQLKTELLLLNKPPLSNKIAVELNFDNNKQKFVTQRIITSSGENSVDKLILQTISKVLDMNLKTNMSVFKTLTGNPILVIRL